MGGDVARMGGTRNIYKPEGRDYFGDAGVDEKIIIMFNQLKNYHCN
jgi:hypothetical protein